MKKTTTVILALSVLSLSLLKTENTFAQRGSDAPASVITAGAGWSLVGALFGAANQAVGDTNGYDLKQTPVLIADYDYNLSPKFSIGVAYSYQSFSTNYTNYYTTNSAGASYYATYKNKLTRMNFGIRPLFHFGNSDELDPYFGLRISYTQWSYNTTNPDPLYDASGTIKLGSTVHVQVLFGSRYYITDNIGVCAEVGIGTPYLAMVGLNFRF